MATQTKIRIALDKHLLIDRTVRTVANDAAFAHRRVFKNKRASLAAMTLRTALILPRHGQAACRLEDIATVRVMALHTVHVAFDDGMVMRQVKFGVNVKVTLKTGCRVFTWIDDELRAATGLDVPASRTVAGFAAGLANHCRVARMNSRMRAGGKYSGDFLVTIRAGLVADIMRAGNFQR